MSIQFDKIYDVVIVGGGPVGMGLAIELGQRGISVAVAEKYPTLHHVPKGQNLTQRTVEHFHFWGCEAELRSARTVPTDYGIGGMTSYDTLLSGYHYDWLQRHLVRPYYYTDNERLPQYATEQVLRDRATEIPTVDIDYGWSAEGVTQNSDTATVSLRARDGGEVRELTGRYLVGADGSHSTVREVAGITQTKVEHDKKMVLLVFRSTDLHELLKRYPDKQFYCVLKPEMQGYWMFFGRVDLGTTWFFHAPVPADTTKENFDFKAYVETAVGAEIDVEFDYVGFWDLRFAIADNYRAGRVFVAGDAAHSHPPYGGYGINTGFEDARNLGWKLAAVLQGWGSDALLDSYDVERRPVFASTADNFIERFIHEDRDFLNRHNPDTDEPAFRHAWDTRNEGSAEVMAFEPNYDGSPIVAGHVDATPGALGSHEFRARAGHHLAPRTLGDGSNAYHRLGPDFTLFALGHCAAEAAVFRAAANRLGMTLHVVKDTGGEARQDWQAGLVLVRPDQYVAWAGDSANGNAQAILSRAVAED